MSEVWLLLEIWDFEGTMPLGVYSSPEVGMDAVPTLQANVASGVCEKRTDNESGQPQVVLCCYK